MHVGQHWLKYKVQLVQNVTDQNITNRMICIFVRKSLSLFSPSVIPQQEKCTLASC